MNAPDLPGSSSRASNKSNKSVSSSEDFNDKNERKIGSFGKAGISLKLLEHDMNPCKTMDDGNLRMPTTPFANQGSFGKASISSQFSFKSNNSSIPERENHLDNLMKQIQKDPSPSLHGLEALNDATNIKVTINKTSELEMNNDTLKKLSGDKPNNQVKLTGVAAALPQSQIKCNILKGELLLLFK